MIDARLQINGANIFSMASVHGLVYISSDNRFEAPLKEFEKTSYPEQEGENISNKTVSDAFDYKTKWFINAKGSLENANAIINKFNLNLYSANGDIKEFFQVKLFNDYKKVIIVGTPSLIQEATEFWRDANGKQHDVVCVEWVIRVSKPSLCDFNLR